MANLLGPTHSLMNNIAANSRQPQPVVGMGATELMASDRHAYTVIEVVSPRKIVVRQDKATRTDKNGMSEVQVYTYAPNEDGRTRTVTLRKNGRWVTEGESLKNGTCFAIGDRDEHYDYTR